MPHSKLIALSRDFIKEQDGYVAPLPLSEEELNPVAPEDMKEHAYSLEATRAPFAVPFSDRADGGCSGFRFFEDGRQRTLQIGHIPVNIGGKDIMLPVHYFIVAAVILERVDRQLRVWEGPIIKQGLLVAESLIRDQGKLNRYREEEGLTVVSTEPTGGSALGSDDYYDLKRRALSTAKDQRLAVAQELIKRWRESVADDNAFLVVDGTLMNLRDAESERRCVGISKSFTARYFDVPVHNRIMQMRANERSWVFRFHDPAGDDDQRLGARDRLSWYLRLRDKTQADPEFGLIRVEVSKAYADEASSFADQFSKWLLSDRLPTAYPSPRWDKHLYPIRACENYLSSIMPSLATITAGVRG